MIDIHVLKTKIDNFVSDLYRVHDNPDFSEQLEDIDVVAVSNQFRDKLYASAEEWMSLEKGKLCLYHAQSKHELSRMGRFLALAEENSDTLAVLDFILYRGEKEYSFYQHPSISIEGNDIRMEKYEYKKSDFNLYLITDKILEELENIYWTERSMKYILKDLW